jgi:hypothetical protein
VKKIRPSAEEIRRRKMGPGFVSDHRGIAPEEI